MDHVSSCCPADPPVVGVGRRVFLYLALRMTWPESSIGTDDGPASISANTCETSGARSCEKESMLGTSDGPRVKPCCDHFNDCSTTTLTETNEQS